MKLACWHHFRTDDEIAKGIRACGGRLETPTKIAEAQSIFSETISL